MRFDEPNLVANAGLLLVGTLVVRLDLERLVDSAVRLSGRVGGSGPGRKVLTVVHAIVAGGSHIDHADMLRSGATQRVLPFRVMAPSAIVTFLRSFSFGHVRQVEVWSVRCCAEPPTVSVGVWRRAGFGPPVDRRGLDYLPGRRQAQTGSGVRLYRVARHLWLPAVGNELVGNSCACTGPPSEPEAYGAAKASTASPRQLAERDARVTASEGPARSLQALRGHVTRQLLGELAEALDAKGAG